MRRTGGGISGSMVGAFLRSVLVSPFGVRAGTADGVSTVPSTGPRQVPSTRKRRISSLLVPELKRITSKFKASTISSNTKAAA